MVHPYQRPFELAAEIIAKRKWFRDGWVNNVYLYPSAENPDCMVLKLYKPHWTGQFEAREKGAKQTRFAGLFFSVWTTAETYASDKVMYNIHALKLRHLAGYKLESRKFAADFRKRFAVISKKWPDVRTDMGPLTLMEGHIISPLDECGKKIVALAENLPDAGKIVDGLLDARKG